MSRTHVFVLLLVLLMSAFALAQQNPAIANPQPATPATPGVATPTAEPATPGEPVAPAIAVARERDRAQIQSLVQQFDQAAEQNDVATIDRMLAPNYRAINAWGVKEDKGDILHAHKDNNIKFEAVDIRDQNIQVNGDTATEQNTADVKGVYKGSRFDGTYSSERTFQRQPDGNWQIVSFVVHKVQ